MPAVVSGWMARIHTLTAARLREVLDYNPETGVFRWRVNRRGFVRAGDVAGTINGSGYRQIRVDRTIHNAARLAWLHVHGEFPPHEVDHRNLVRNDDRLVNLRPATHGQNTANQRKRSDNASGFKGVSLHSRTGKWQAHVRARGEHRYLGLFASAEEAAIAYRVAAAELHGEFARLG